MKAAGTSSVPAQPNAIHDWLESALGLDLRSLALFRIGLASVLLCDLFTRILDLRGFYTDSGVLPAAEFLARYARPGVFTLGAFSGSFAAQSSLFAVAAIFALALLLGYRTRVALLGAWVCLLFIQDRNPEILFGGDVLLRIVMFWSLFLPIGARFSLDARAGREAAHSKRELSVASFAYLVQIALIYWVTFYLKSGVEWRQQGSALWYALSLHYIADPFGQSLLRWPGLLRFLTRATLVVDAVAPMFLFLPWGVGWFRLATILLLGGMQFGMALTLRVGIFQWIALVSLLALVPSGLWDRLRPERVNLESRPHATPLSHFRQGLALFFLAVALAANVAGTWPQWQLPMSVNAVADFFHLKQRWGMFAPRPPDRDGWYVIPGTLEDGRVVDLFRNGAAVSFDEPSFAGKDSHFTGFRWRRFLMTTYWYNDGLRRADFAGYLCREWNATAEARHVAAVRSLELDAMMRTVQPPGAPAAPYERVVLGRYSCTSPPSDVAHP